MNAKNIKIATQLKFGFIAMLFFVVLLGVVSYFQTDEIQSQMDDFYDHPLQVRRALGNLNAEILSMRLGTRDLMVAKTEEEKLTAIQLIETSCENVPNQFTVLRERYLGPKSDVEDAYNAFITWKVARAENTRLLLSGEVEKVKQSVRPEGSVGALREIMLNKIKKIDDFAARKGDLLYSNSQTLQNSLNRQLILIVTVILLLSIIMYNILLRNIRKPLEEINSATHRFHEGDLSARSNYKLNNEFGTLSDSFNTLAESIQENIFLNEKIANISSVMLSEDDARKFFYATLNELALHTDSQMAAAYILSDDNKSYTHFESIGVDENAKESFSSDIYEGEFGFAISLRKVQHLKSIPEDTRFVFHTVTGKFYPHEILTIPVISENNIIAVISLASIKPYSAQAVKLINDILVTLSTRVAGILAYRKIKDFSAILSEQNSELEMQKTELSLQSSELIEQNAELEMQKQQLDEASRLKTVFLSNMSHELRTPLNSVIALSGVLNRRLAKQIPEEEYSYLEVIERNGKNLLSLINDILDISRIEAGKEEIDLSIFDFNSLVSEVVQMIKPQAEQKNLKLLHTAGESKLSITCDADKCRHILQNLIANAVKFTEKGKVEVITEQNKNKITVKIIDTGVGIAEEHLSHIFDEFRQADGSTSRKFGGTGLGLAIAKKYANFLGGTITVKSQLGSGAEFTLTLPTVFESANRIVETISSIEFKPAQNYFQYKHTGTLTNKTILLVEDSEPAIIQIKDILEEGGNSVLVARDGAEALKIISHTIPDAMILDLMMPGVDGFQVLKTIREEDRTAHIPVLILTAKHITKEELKFLKRNNIHQLIQKGDVNRVDLKNSITEMIFPKSVMMQPKREAQVIEGKPLVLVVEDNPDSMTTARALLSDEFNIIEAVDGFECVEKAKLYKPNLILMDIALPVMDGIEAFQAIRKLPELNHTPIIALTASAMIKDRETVLAYGFDAFISKPIDEKIFFRIIKDVLNGK